MSESQVIPEVERELRGLELAARHFPDQRRQQVADYLGVPHDDPAMLPFLAVCASLNLSPISGHVWLLPQRKIARDGAEDTIVYRPAIGRDGLLHKALQTRGQPGGYIGMQQAVVCEGDDFEVVYDGSFDGPKVLHRFATKPTAFPPDADPSRYRGRVIGAWAKCFIDGAPPVFYYAPVHEHAQLHQVHAWNPEERRLDPLYRHPKGGTTFEPFTRLTEDAGAERNEPVVEFHGTWEYLSGMIGKCAQSYVLRVGMGVTGVVPVDELRGGQLAVDSPDPALTTSAPAFSDAAEFDVRSFLGHVGEELRERLARAVAAAVERDRFAWSPAKCEMVMKDRPADQLVQVAEQIERENAHHEQRAEAATEPPPSRPPTPDLSEDQRQAKVAELRTAQERLTKQHRHAGGDNRVRLRAELDGVEAELRQLGEEV